MEKIISEIQDELSKAREERKPKKANSNQRGWYTGYIKGLEMAIYIYNKHIKKGT